MRPRLKICGVNDAAFAVAAERLGADYLGFIFAPGTPRNVTVEEAAAIVRGLDGRSRRVGVFVRQSVDEIRETVRAVGLEIVQLHRRASPEDVAALQKAGLEVWTLAGGAPGNGVLFDSSHGDGETQIQNGPWTRILAGGVSAANLADALAAAPDVVDVSGSLESRPGVKSIPLLQDFMSAWNSAIIPKKFARS